MPIMNWVFAFFHRQTIITWNDKQRRAVLTMKFVRSVPAVVISVAHHLIWNALPVRALELRDDAAAWRRRTVAFVGSVAAVVCGVTHLPPRDAALICTAELVTEAAMFH